jgi:hypothetical protein
MELFRYPEAMEKQRRATFDYFKGIGKTLTKAELEIACFSALKVGHKLKGEFNISLTQMRWNDLYLEKDGYENYWFTSILRATCMHRRLFLVGTASGGKTFSLAVSGMNFWGAAPKSTTFLVTSTDSESLKSKIWGTILDLHERDRLKIGHRINYEDAIVINPNAKDRDVRDAIKAIALPKGSEGEKAIGKVQGRKNANIIWAADEYGHMDPFVKKARSNLRMGCLSFGFWACSNKPEEGDPMFQDAMPDPEKYPLGWETPGLDELEGWETVGGGYCLYLDGLKSPNLQAPAGAKDPFPMLTRRESIEEERKESGEDGYGWWKYVRAFPRAGSTHDKLIDSKFLERYRALEGPVWADPNWITVAGLDAAWTQGGDDCTADFGRVGVSETGVKILAHEPDAIRLNVKVSGKGTFEEQLSHVFIEECRKRDCHVVAIDISGSGGRLANALVEVARKEGWKLEMIAVDSAGRPDEDSVYPVGSVNKKGRELFDRKVSEVWVGYRLAVQEGWIRGVSLTAKATREMNDRRISSDVDKKWVVEPKKDYKERNQGKSPDNSEARVLLCWGARKHGLGADLMKRQKQIPKNSILTDAPSKPSPYGYSRGKGAYAW